MTTYEVTCPNCGTLLEATTELEGSDVNCPNCTQSFSIPARSVPPDTTPAKKQIHIPKGSRQKPSEIPQKEAPPAKGGALSGLLDFEFTEFITPSLIRRLYMWSFYIGFIAAAGLMLMSILNIVSGDIIFGFIALTAVPIVLLIYLTWVRVLVEFIMVVFRIEQHARKSTSA